MNIQLVENIIKAWAYTRNKEMPLSYTIEHTYSDHYDLTLPNGDYTTFVIDERAYYYSIGVLASHLITVTADEPVFDLHEEDIQDYEGCVDNLYDDIANSPSPQWVCNIPFDPPHIRPSNECIIEKYLNKWMEETGIDKKQILFWYITEYALPPFLDQTQKHMAREFMHGIRAYDIEEVYQYWAERMEEGDSIECLLDEVAVYYDK